MSNEEPTVAITINIPRNIFKFYENFNLWAKAYYDVRALIESIAVRFLEDHTEQIATDPTFDTNPKEILKAYGIDC